MVLRIATTDSHSNMIVYAPWLVEKLALSATETVAQPSMRHGVLEWQRVQKGDPVLWKRICVERELQDAGVEERDEDEDEGKERHDPAEAMAEWNSDDRGPAISGGLAKTEEKRKL